MGINLCVSGIKFKIGFIDRYWLDLICTTRIYDLIELRRQGCDGGGDDDDDDDGMEMINKGN